MYGINLQLFNSKLRISFFDNFPKKLHFLRKTCGCAQIAQKKCGFAQIAQKNRAKLKFRFRNFRKKYFRFCANSAKLIAFHAHAKVHTKNLAILWKPYFNQWNIFTILLHSTAENAGLYLTFFTFNH